MEDFHKELLKDMTKDWTIERLEVYIAELNRRVIELNWWIGYVKDIKKKKLRKQLPVDTGVRSGT